jgi:hypothetical protein
MDSPSNVIAFAAPSSLLPGDIGGVMGPLLIMAADSRKNGAPTWLSFTTHAETDDDGWEDGGMKLCIIALDQDMNN